MTQKSLRDQAATFGLRFVTFDARLEEAAKKLMPEAVA